MDGRGGLVVYVTSHGFGHLNRAVAVVNRMPALVPVTVRCDPNLFGHWRERLLRPAALEPHVSDAGAVNPPGDSAATDGAATLERAALVHAEALAGLDEEAQRLRDLGAAAVLCDVPPLPLVAARRAGVPGFLLANFTWADIYAPHARKLGPEAVALVGQLRRAYRQAAAVFRAEPALKLADFDPDKLIEVGMVVVPGRDRGDALRRRLGIDPGAKLVYCYVGRYGQADLGWDRLAALGEKGVHFVGFHPAPVGPLPNLHLVSPDEWTGADLAASTDAMVAKAGYGTACEAMAAGTPMIYPPRTGFAEHRALDRALRDWGGGLPATAREFASLRIEHLLDRAFSLKPGPPPFPADGAARVADRLAQTCQSAPAKGRGTR
jgi:hypothetical protein